MISETKKVGRREKYPFATWQVGDEFSKVCVYDLIPTMLQRLRCAANNRKGDASWRFNTSVRQSSDVDYSIVTIRRIK